MKVSVKLFLLIIVLKFKVKPFSDFQYIDINFCSLWPIDAHCTKLDQLRDYFRDEENLYRGWRDIPRNELSSSTLSNCQGAEGDTITIEETESGKIDCTWYVLDLLWWISLSLSIKIFISMNLLKRNENLKHKFYLFIYNLKTIFQISSK